MNYHLHWAYFDRKGPLKSIEVCDLTWLGLDGIGSDRPGIAWFKFASQFFGMFLFRQGHLLMYHVNMGTSSEPSVQLLRLVSSLVLYSPGQWP
jgi:hypothetical protein